MTITPKTPPDINYVTPDQFPNDYAVWGDEGFERINKLLDNAVNLISTKSKSAVIDYAGLSKIESKKDKPVVFINCKNLDRYYINEQNIINGELPKLMKSSL